MCLWLLYERGRGVNMETYISEELIKGNPSEILERVTKEMATQIIYMSIYDYADICCNMRLMADLFEILFEHINDYYVELKYNPMGSWYLVED